MKTKAQRFLAKVDVVGECWLWTGATKGEGIHAYGMFWDGNRQGLAYRWAYEEVVGPIPDGLELDHLCRNVRCVRPSHLEPVTHRENMVRGMGFVGENVRKTRCPSGHAYDLFNTMMIRGGRARRCRTCKNEQRRVTA